MNRTLLVIIIIILIILIYRAWNKNTIYIYHPIPKRNVLSYNEFTENNNQLNVNDLEYNALLNTDKKKPHKNSVTPVKEEICRNIFEKIYNKPFPTKRPSFLKNPDTGRNLELDGYNEELKIAFEYNGQQHYDFPNTFHKTLDEFQRQVERDKFKKEKCNQNNIKLITIPYTVDKNDMESFIKTKLGLPINHKIDHNINHNIDHKINRQSGFKPERLSNLTDEIKSSLTKQLTRYISNKATNANNIYKLFTEILNPSILTQ